MSALLFGAGAFAVVAGAVMIGFGIPINEFSFGNTLIGAGVTAAIGGLIVIGLGVVVAQLQRMGDALVTRTPARPNRPLEVLEPAAGSRAAPLPGRTPFPAEPNSAPGNQPYSLESRIDPSIPTEAASAQSYAPTLRNPDEPPVTVEDDVSLSPQHPMAAPTPASANLGANVPPAPPQGLNGSRMSERHPEPTLDADWRPAVPPAPPAQTRQPPTAYFDAMWPAEPKTAKSPAGNEAKPEPTLSPAFRDAAAAPAKRVAEPEVPNPRHGNEPRSVGILKSGVVDGMAYTLYVDGSIEAELPQGTLRFASINELRSHLEKNT